MEKDFFDVFPHLKVKKELEELLDMVFVTKVSMNPGRTHLRVYIESSRWIHKKNIFALDGTTILRQIDKEVQMAVNEFGNGRCVYISGLPYSFENSRLLYRSIIWSAHDEENLHKWFSSNFNVEVHAYVKNGKYCVVNNTYEPQSTTVYKGDGTSFDLDLDANEIVWYEI